MKSRVVFVLKISCVIALWFFWKKYASVEFCMAFWISALAYIVSLVVKKRIPGRFFILLGITSNAFVTTLNGGVMPVSGMPVTMYPQSPIWRHAEGYRWTILGDHRVLYYFSVGDLMLLASLLLYAIVKIRSVVSKNKRLRGVKQCTICADC